METENFFFTGKSLVKNLMNKDVVLAQGCVLRRKIFKIVFYSFVLFLLACSSVDRRSKEIRVDGVRPIVTAENQDKSISQQSLDVDISGQQLLSVIPDGENLRIGLILGPGALRSFAHVGILKAFEENKIPVKAVVGLEWGSLVAAFYARKGEAFDVEWQMLKLKEGYLPSTGLLSSQTKMKKTDDLQGYLEETFSESEIKPSQLNFSCPVYELSQSENMIWRAEGKYTSVLKDCLSYPPYYLPRQERVAGAFALSQSVKELKSAGVNQVFFVNVLKGKGFFDRNQVSFVTEILWQKGEQTLRLQKAEVDEFIDIDMNGFGFMSYDLRREMIQRGYEAGQEKVLQLKSKYGF